METIKCDGCGEEITTSGDFEKYTIDGVIVYYCDKCCDSEDEQSVALLNK